MGNICICMEIASSSYKKDRRLEEALLYFDSNLKNRTKEILSNSSGGPGASGAVSTDDNFLADIIGFTEICNQETKDAILECKKDVLCKSNYEGRKGKKKLEAEKESLNKLMNKYFEDTNQMLDFVAKLDKFIKSANDRHKYVADVVRQYFQVPAEISGTPDHLARISETLKELKASKNSNHDDISVKELMDNIRSLTVLHKNMSDSLTHKKGQFIEKLKTTGAWIKVVNMLFVCTVVAEVTCMIVIAIFASPAAAAALSAAVVPTIAGINWIQAVFEDRKNDLHSKVKLITQIERGNQAAMNKLAGIEFLVHVVENEIDSLLSHPNPAMNKAQVDYKMNDIKNKLDQFLKKINNLEARVENFSQEILNARDEVERATKVL